MGRTFAPESLLIAGAGGTCQGRDRGSIDGNWAQGRQESAWQTTVGAKGSWVHAGGGLEAVGSPRGAIESRSTAARSLRKEVMSTRRVWGPAQAWPRVLRGQSPSPVPAGGVARLQGHWDRAQRAGSGVGSVFKCRRPVVETTHDEDKCFSSRASRARSPTGTMRQKDAMSTLMDLHMRKRHIYPAYWSGRCDPKS